MASKLVIAAVLALPVALAVPQSGLTNTRSSDIIGGEDANPGDFPSIVAITYEDAKGVISCGGSLANENTVITAAHCSTGDVAKYSVRAGSLVCFPIIGAGLYILIDLCWLELDHRWARGRCRVDDSPSGIQQRDLRI